MADTPAPDCLISLLGLSTGSACFPLPAGPDAAAGIAASATGLYLDMAEGLKLQAAAGATPATDLYDKLDKARALATFQVRLALEAGRAKSAGIPLYQKRGTLGGLGNGQLAPVGTRALISFYTNARREGAWRITKLQLFTDRTVTDVPLLLDGEEVALLSSGTPLSSTIGLPGGGLLIPLDGNQHTLEAVLPDGVRVKANNLFAGCFSCQRGTPWFSSVMGTAQPNGSYQGGSLQYVTAQTPGNGFALSVVEECTAEPDLLCFAVGKDEGREVFRYPELARYVAIAILYKAAELFTDGLLAGQQTNRYTMLEPKALAALADKYRGQAAEYVAWLNSPDGLGQVRHPCYLSPPVAGPGKEWTL